MADCVVNRGKEMKEPGAGSARGNEIEENVCEDYRFMTAIWQQHSVIINIYFYNIHTVLNTAIKEIT